MGGFRVDSEDWSLGAIVRGSINDFPKIEDVETNVYQNPRVSNIPTDDDQGFLAGFPEIFEVPTGSCDDLEDLYKQFYQVPHPLPPCTILDFQEQKAQIGDEELKAAREVSEHSSGSSSSVSRVTDPGYAPKYKRRKNHQKRVVIQVSADGITSDLWAWRKYGQKPIKGSPFPRSYYRCSSSKGCLARKQVEQSCTDPGKFIITYTAEHRHSHPTRRNSLAGTVRQKFPVTKMSNESKNVNSTLNQVDVVFPPVRRIKEEEKRVAENEVRIKEENLEDYSDIAMPELLLDDDFFPELDDLMKNSPSSTCYDSLPQLSLKFL